MTTKQELYEILKNGLQGRPEIFYNDHGWNEVNIKIRYPGCDILASIADDGVSVSVGCPCMVFTPAEALNETVPLDKVVEKINSMRGHRCIPWPG